MQARAGGETPAMLRRVRQTLPNQESERTKRISNYSGMYKPL